MCVADSNANVLTAARISAAHETTIYHSIVTEFAFEIRCRRHADLPQSMIPFTYLRTMYYIDWAALRVSLGRRDDKNPFCRSPFASAAVALIEFPRHRPVSVFVYVNIPP